MTLEFQRLFAGYHCVFAGDPKKCTPYAAFATRVQAENLNKDIIGRCPIMTVEEWAKQYENTDASAFQSCNRCGERIRGQSYQANGETVCGLCFDDILNGKQGPRLNLALDKFCLNISAELFTGFTAAGIALMGCHHIFSSSPFHITSSNPFHAEVADDEIEVAKMPAIISKDVVTQRKRLMSFNAVDSRVHRSLQFVQGFKFGGHKNAVLSRLSHHFAHRMIAPVSRCPPCVSAGETRQIRAGVACAFYVRVVAGPGGAPG